MIWLMNIVSDYKTVLVLFYKRLLEYRDFKIERDWSRSIILTQFYYHGIILSIFYIRFWSN